MAVEPSGTPCCDYENIAVLGSVLGSALDAAALGGVLWLGARHLRLADGAPVTIDLEHPNTELLPKIARSSKSRARQSCTRDRGGAPSGLARHGSQDMAHKAPLLHHARGHMLDRVITTMDARNRHMRDTTPSTIARLELAR